MAESHKRTLRIALIGKTGAGKSAVGNTLLGREAFDSFTSFESVTEFCQMEKQTLPSGIEIEIVDTPGIMDSRQLDVKDEVTKSIAYLSPGPHAFLLVLQPSRATREEVASLKQLKELFGDYSYLQNTIIIMVRRNEIRNRDRTLMDIHQFIEQRTCKEVLDLYRLCGKRIVAIDNTETDPKIKEEYRNSIIDMVMKFRGYFSHAYFEMSQEKQKLIKLLAEEKEAKAIEMKRLADIAALTQEQLKEQKQQLQKEKEERDRDKEQFEKRLEKTLTLLEDQMNEKNRRITRLEEQLNEKNKKTCVMS